MISNGVATLAERQASGDLPARVTVLPGQEGTGDEGTAMLEIVHDLAPDAELYFATGFSGRAQFAANIEALCEAGADVIVDDIGYYLEANFQDGIIAQGVNAATADGCYFFSAAGNAGNLNDGTSGVWEGDYVAGTSLIVEGSTVGVRHDFGGGKEENPVERFFRGTVVLQWADPLGASANDYDLFLVDGEGNVLLSSTDTQDGAQDPIERISSGIFAYGDARLVIVKVSGADRYLRLQVFDGVLEIATAGTTWGHPAAENAVGVGQVDVRTAGGAGGIFDGTESVATTSSDGPRRVFFEPDGTAITPGNFSSTGGEVLQKPDLTAAACVSTATPGFLDVLRHIGSSPACSGNRGADAGGCQRPDPRHPGRAPHGDDGDDGGPRHRGGGRRQRQRRRHCDGAGCSRRGRGCGRGSQRGPDRSEHAGRPDAGSGFGRGHHRSGEHVHRSR